jgi:hypothetical protein
MDDELLRALVDRPGPRSLGSASCWLFPPEAPWPRATTLPDPLQAGWNGRAVCEALQDDADRRILRCTFPPGVGSAEI